MNLAARAAHWSATHRKAAIFGWLGFVVLAVLVGQTVGQNKISDVDQFNGESHRAEQALDESGLRPTTRGGLRAEPRRSRSTTPSSGRRSRTRRAGSPRSKYVENVKSPLGGGGAGHRRPPLRAGGVRDRRRLRRRPRIASIRCSTPSTAVQAAASGPAGRAVRRRQRQQGGQRDLQRRPREGGELSLPITLIILMIAFGSLVAAGVPLLLGDHRRDRRDGAGRDPEPDLPGRQQPLRGDPADRARGRRRLLALLPATRARGARRRAQPGGCAAGRRRDLGPRRADLRPDRDRRDGRHVHQRRQDLHLVRRSGRSSSSRSRCSPR